MITFYFEQDGVLAASEDRAAIMDKNILWYDALEPSREDEQFLEDRLKIDVPTREEIREIEASSRFYSENDTLYATVLYPVENDQGEIVPVDVNVVIGRQNLITVRYQFTKILTAFAQRGLKKPPEKIDMMAVHLLEAYIAAVADMLQKRAEKLDVLSKQVFAGKGRDSRSAADWQALFSQIALAGQALATKRESLVSFGRAASFLLLQTQHGFCKEAQEHLQTLERDCSQLAEHATYLSDKVTFLLDATLGLLNVEQNQVLKAFSVVSVVLMPPTLIGAIYGMNFHEMPELSWHLGYPLALLLMAISAVLPLVYFKMKRWL